MKQKNPKTKTEIKITDAPKNLSMERQILLVGSCFSDNIGGKMIEEGWNALVNPCGTVYNPISIAALFRTAISSRRNQIIRSSLTSREGRVASWLMGKKGLGATESECIEKVDNSLTLLEKGLRDAQAAIVTFGTSDVWHLVAEGSAVGNCHKHPAREFIKRRMSVNEIITLWKDVIAEIREINPNLQIVFTVSPRRYLSEGAAENTRQKAILILAVDSLCKEIQDVYYFPAYEIMNDDLRDYRFYAPDLLHPSAEAVDYIWQKFRESFT